MPLRQAELQKGQWLIEDRTKKLIHLAYPKMQYQNNVPGWQFMGEDDVQGWAMVPKLMSEYSLSEGPKLSEEQTN